MVGEAILQVDGGERRRELAQIGGGRTDQTGKLAETPMGWGDRSLRAWQDQAQPFGIISARFHMDTCALDGPRAAALGPRSDRAREISERKETLIIRP